MPINKDRKIIRTSDYPPNKNIGGKKPKEVVKKPEETRVKAVVKSSDISVRKPTLGSKMKKSFLGEQGREMGSYIFADVLIPTVVDSLSDLVQNTVWSIFNGGRDDRAYGGYRRRPAYGSGRNHTDYGSRSRRQPERRSREEYRYKDRWDFSQYEFRTRPAAVEVRDRLFAIADEFGHARVGDFFDLIGEEWEYTEGDWVWFLEDIERSTVKRARGSGKFILDLPNPEPLK